MKIIGIFMAIFISGCSNMMETMFTHYRLNEDVVAVMARRNAAINVCLANNSIDKNISYAYSSVNAQFLDITVIDKDFYKKTYETAVDQLQSIVQKESMSDVRQGCNELEKSLPIVTEQMAKDYIRISNDLAKSRSQERQQMAIMMSNFGSNMRAMNFPATYSWPNISYLEERTPNVNYLVNTSKGMVQCRITNKNYVFCM